MTDAKQCAHADLQIAMTLEERPGAGTTYSLRCLRCDTTTGHIAYLPTLTVETCRMQLTVAAHGGGRR